MTVLVQGLGGDNHLNVTEGKALKGQSKTKRKEKKKPKDAKVAKNNGRELDRKITILGKLNIHQRPEKWLRGNSHNHYLGKILTRESQQ